MVNAMPNTHFCVSASSKHSATDAALARLMDFRHELYHTKTSDLSCMYRASHSLRRLEGVGLTEGSFPDRGWIQIRSSNPFQTKGDFSKQTKMTSQERMSFRLLRSLTPCSPLLPSSLRGHGPGAAIHRLAWSFLFYSFFLISS